MLKITIFEDKTEIKTKIKEYIEKYSLEKEIETEIKFFESSEKFLSKIKDFDIAMIDVDNDGIDVATELRAKNKEIPLALITSVKQFSINGYLIDAVDFLTNNSTYYEFSTLMDRLQMRLVKMEIPDVAIMTKQGIKRVSVNQIAYIEGSFNHVIYHLENEEEIRIRGSLNEEEKKLTRDRFFRLGDMLLNLGHVYKVKGFDVYVGDTCLSLPQNKKQVLLNSLLAYMNRG